MYKIQEENIKGKKKYAVASKTATIPYTYNTLNKTNDCFYGFSLIRKFISKKFLYGKKKRSHHFKKLNIQ